MVRDIVREVRMKKHSSCQAYLAQVQEDFINKYGKSPLEGMRGTRLCTGITVAFPKHAEANYFGEDCCLSRAKAVAINKFAERIVVR